MYKKTNIKDGTLIVTLVFCLCLYRFRKKLTGAKVILFVILPIRKRKIFLPPIFVVLGLFIFFFSKDKIMMILILVPLMLFIISAIIRKYYH